MELELPTFEEIFTNVCERLSRANEVQEISKQFFDTVTDENRVNIAYTRLSDLDLLPFKRNSNKISSKLSEKSIELRNAGNKAFGKVEVDMQEVILLYTKSIAFGVKEELALAFANRSAVLFAMCKYENCLNDIQQALLFDYPDKLKYKVIERKGKCLQKLGLFEEASKCFQEVLDGEHPENKTKSIQLSLKQLLSEEKDNQPTRRQTRILPQLSYGHNKEVTCASDCIAIKYSTTMGRYIEAVSDIKPGDILLLEEPYASVLLPAYYYTHCYHCLQRCVALIPCKHCSMVMFCSDLCRETSWKKSHHIECLLLPSLHQLEMGKMWLLALRVFLVSSDNGLKLAALHKQIQSIESNKITDNRTKGFDKHGLYVSSNYDTIHNLVGNTESRTVSDLFKRATQAACILNCIEEGSDLFKRVKPNKKLNMFVGGLLLRYLQSLPCNAHSVSELMVVAGQGGTQSVEFGCGAYSTLSLINHSCDPNVTRCNYSGDGTMMMAVRPIKKGEQILDNYGYHYAVQTTEERLTGLRTQYYFDCQCECCLNNWPTYHNLPNRNPTYICLRCRTNLTKPNLNANSGDIIITCPQCQTGNNITDSEKKLQSILDNFNVIYEKLLSENYDVDFTSELSGNIELLDQIVQRPWRLFNDCQEAMKECFLRAGNFYIQRRRLCCFCAKSVSFPSQTWSREM